MCAWKEHNGQVEEEEEEEEETKEEAKEEADEEAEEEPEEEEEEESEEEAEEESEEEAEEEADFWKRVEKRMNKVGPILRFIFNGKKCKSRVRACKFAVNNITASMLQYYTGIGTGKSCNGHHVSHKLVKVVRVREKDKIESSLNVLISPYLERKTLSKMESEMKRTDFIFLVLSIWDYVIPHLLEKCAVSAFLNEDFLRAIRTKMRN
ncbi:putative retrotransposon hot spot (RHS) protein [Trypanosoma cruzi]|uniref:Putative retrotransposon hot spot (RHS) protein n=1 Tax=Trypanosoma cruzi TaxID=5693 RepID=A0A2V2UH25_TRYCR|nr:putative retrotransposon hot spot (RHS) protein [Trypanosoma cruzi]